MRQMIINRKLQHQVYYPESATLENRNYAGICSYIYRQNVERSHPISTWDTQNKKTTYFEPWKFQLFFQLQLPLRLDWCFNFDNSKKSQVSRHARSQTLFDEIFGSQSNSAERSNFSATDSLYQVLQFYLGMIGQNPFAADSMTSYGCWCQLRNQAAGTMVAGIFFIPQVV